MENEEQVDSTIDESGAETTQEEATEETQIDTEDVETLRGELEKERKARQQLTARAKRAEEALKNAKPKQESTNLATNTGGNDPVLDEALDLRLDGYSKDEVSFILKNGGRKAIEDKDSYVSLALQTKREQLRAEEAASKAQDTTQMTGVSKKYSQAQLEKMSSEELEKILPKTN